MNGKLGGINIFTGEIGVFFPLLSKKKSKICSISKTSDSQLLCRYIKFKTKIKVYFILKFVKILLVSACKDYKREIVKFYTFMKFLHLLGWLS